MADSGLAHVRARAGEVQAVPTVSALFVYPVKSMRGAAVARVRTVRTGFEWDRQWMVIDGKGTFLSQRTHPLLARIVPEITSEALVLSTQGQPPLRVPLALAGPQVPVRVWKDPCSAVEQGSEAHEWVSEVLHQRVRLVRVAPAMTRDANREFAGDTAAPLTFPDGYPILICNEASLEELNGRLPERIPMQRFRPNLVLSGLDAWAEDRIDTLTIGALTLRLVKPCVRCAIPSLDHLTGAASTDPMPVLRKFRFSKALKGITFGENAVLAAGAGADIARGASCQVSFDIGLNTPATPPV